jgi:hypothetical protein
MTSHRGLYIASILTAGWQDTPITTINVNNREQVLAKSTILRSHEPVTWEVTVHCLEPQTPGTQELNKQLQEVVPRIKPNLNARETQDLE